MDDKTATIEEAREALAARKENRRKQNPTEIAHKMYRMNFEGNIIPHSWYIHIKRENGKPYTIAIVLLSEIVYWYRPEEVKDEATGQVVGLRKRYAADKLQRTYDSFADEFGFTKRQVKDALKHLESMAIIDLDFRDIPVGDNVAGNVLFIGLDPDRLAEITYHPPSDEKTIDPLPSDESASEVYQFNVRGLTENGQTNTETTPETTPEITEEDISLSAQKTDSTLLEPPIPTPAAPTDDEPLDAGLDLYWQHCQETQANQKASGNYAAPPSAGGDDGLAVFGLFCLYDKRGKQPPRKGTKEHRQQCDKVRESLRVYGYSQCEPEIVEKAAELFCERKGTWVNVFYRSFVADFGVALQDAEYFIEHGHLPDEADSRKAPRHDSGKFDRATRLTLERLGHGDR